MPGRWYSPADDAEYFSQVKFKDGDLLEIVPKDWAGSDQDSVVISVTSAVSNENGSGFWILGKFVTAKDPYFHWWINGPAKDFAEGGHYHFCRKLGCKATRADDPVDSEGKSAITRFFRYRTLNLGDLTEKTVAWFAAPIVKKQIATFLEGEDNEDDDEENDEAADERGSGS